MRPCPPGPPAHGLRMLLVGGPWTVPSCRPLRRQVRVSESGDSAPPGPRGSEWDGTERPPAGSCRRAGSGRSSGRTEPRRGEENTPSGLLVNLDPKCPKSDRSNGVAEDGLRGWGSPGATGATHGPAAPRRLLRRHRLDVVAVVPLRAQCRTALLVDAVLVDVARPVGAAAVVDELPRVQVRVADPGGVAAGLDRGGRSDGALLEDAVRTTARVGARRCPGARVGSRSSSS